MKRFRRHDDPRDAALRGADAVASGGPWRLLLAGLAALLALAAGGVDEGEGERERGRQREEEEDRVSEHELKAAMLYKFVKYVEWPSDRFRREYSPIVVGVYGEDPFGKILDKTFAGKRIGKHGFVIRRLSKLEGARACHILFVPAAHAKELGAVRKAVAGNSVLLVGESPGFAETGGIINFYLSEEETVHFEINPTAAKRERLKVSSSLLKLARIVRDRKEDEEEKGR